MLTCPNCGVSPLTHAIREMHYSYKEQGTTIPDVHLFDGHALHVAAGLVDQHQLPNPRAQRTHETAPDGTSCPRQYPGLPVDVHDERA